MNSKELLAVLKLLQDGTTDFTLQQRRAIEALYRRALVTRDVGTMRYHVNERGEKFMRYLEGIK